MVHGDGKEMKTLLDSLHGTRVNLMARVTLAILKTVYSCFPMTDLPKDFGMIVTVEEPEIRGHCANFSLNLNKQNQLDQFKHLYDPLYPIGVDYI